MEKINRTNFYVLVLGLLLVIFAYIPSFSVPFYLDDRLSILENPLLLHSNVFSLFKDYGLRFVTYASFWFNIQYLNGEIFGFHLINFVIHLCNGVLIYVLTNLFVKNYINTSLSDKQISIFSAVVAFIWLVHPLNTQAVTYIVQRTAALVTMFALITMLSYLKLRLTNNSKLWWFVFIFSVSLGILTKQNYVVIFVFILLFEVVIIRQSSQIIVGLCSLLLFAIALSFPFFSQFYESINSFTKETDAITRYDYFVTQLSVLWIYVKKFFIPLNLQLDMHIDVIKNSTGWEFIAFISHCLLISFAIYLRKLIPLFTIGILWFYAGHSIESFIIPITDLAFEHRSYLPNIGLVWATCSIIYSIFINKTKLLVFSSVIVIFLLAVITYNRNELWNTPYEFYENELSLSPDSPRSKASFAIELIKKGDLVNAEKLLLESVNDNLKRGRITVTSINNLMMLLYQQGKYQTATQTAMLSLRYITKPKEKSYTLTTIAYGYIKMGWCDFAVGLTTTAMKLDPSNNKAREYNQYCKKLRSNG